MGSDAPVLPLWKLKVTDEEYEELKNELKESYNAHGEFNTCKREALLYIDIINHDVMTDCLKQLVEKTPIVSSYSQVERIIKAYLDSYSYVKTMMVYNEDLGYWKGNRGSARMAQLGPCLFKWVKDEDLLCCYSEEELKEVKTELGIPQGGSFLPNRQCRNERCR